MSWDKRINMNLEQSIITVKYSMSYRLVMSNTMNTICNRCDSSNTRIKETNHKDGEVDTYIYKIICLDCGHEQWVN